MVTAITVLCVLGGLALLLLAGSLRVVQQYERGLVFRFGRVLPEARGPGLTLLVPVMDRLRKVNMQVVTLPVPAQDGITRDNVTVRVDAVIYFQVTDPRLAVVNVEQYRSAISQVAQTSLRSIIGKSDLDDLLANREQLNQGLEVMIDSPALGWGIHIDRVEIKDVSLPEAMKRSMSRQAEAERERRSRVISADGELQASEKLAQAAAKMSANPSALQLRLLETVVEVSAEKNSTLVLPFPVELLRFLDKADQGSGEASATQQDGQESRDEAPERAETGRATAPASGPVPEQRDTTGSREPDQPVPASAQEPREQDESQQQRLVPGVPGQPAATLPHNLR